MISYVREEMPLLFASSQLMQPILMHVVSVVLGLHLRCQFLCLPLYWPQASDVCVIISLVEAVSF